MSDALPETAKLAGIVNELAAVVREQNKIIAGLMEATSLNTDAIRSLACRIESLEKDRRA